MYKGAFLHLHNTNLLIIVDNLEMDSDYDDDLYDDATDSGNDSQEGAESEGDADFVMDPGFEDEPSGSSSQKIEDEYFFEVIF